MGVVSEYKRFSELPSVSRGRVVFKSSVGLPESHEARRGQFDLGRPWKKMRITFGALVYDHQEFDSAAEYETFTQMIPN